MSETKEIERWSRSWTSAVERAAYNERTFPVSIHGDTSPGHWRTDRKQGFGPHVQGSPKRHGVKPSGGKVADIYDSPVTPDDAYVIDWENAQETAWRGPLPKTASQTALANVIVEWQAGNRETFGSAEMTAQFIKDGILKIATDDADQSLGFKLETMGCGIWI